MPADERRRRISRTCSSGDTARVPYDAEAVAREVAAAGLPEEYAEKLVRAA